jgi:septum formation protein
MKTSAVVLASQSPRRVQLLREGGVEAVEVVAPMVDELHEAGWQPGELTVENARRKAVWVAERLPGRLIVAADTLVYVDGEPLGKPDNMAGAVEMLKRLAGRTHQVCTGVAIAGPERGQLETFAVITDVTFKELSDEMIRAYHQVCDPLDKAGGYGIQDGTDLILERIEGSFSNVMGLPMEILLPRLRCLQQAGSG